MTITGSNLSNVMGVMFGTTPVTQFSLDSATQITAIAPAGAFGDVEDVTVTSAGGTSATSSADQFTYTASFNPTNINIANESNVSVSGTGTSGDSISVTITDGTNTTKAATTTVANGVWSVTGINAGGLLDGTVTYTVTEKSSAGTTTTTTQTATKLTKPPVLAFTPPNISIDNANSVSVSGTGADGDSISVTITDGTTTTTAATTQVANGAWSVSGINAALLEDGTVTYAVTETDAVGNTTTVTQTATKSTATAGTITVTTNSDAGTHTGTSLRDAIAQAIADNGATIQFASGLAGETIDLSAVDPLGSDDPYGPTAFTITGTGAIIINGSRRVRG